MKMKIVGILVCALLLATALPLASALAKNTETTTEPEIFGRTHIRAIGSFQSCEESQVIYGRIFIGLKGLKLIFNEKIEYSMDDIQWLIMTQHLLNCVIRM